LIGFETLKWGYLEPLPKRNFWVCLNSLDEIDLERTENMNKKKSEKSSASIYKGGSRRFRATAWQKNLGGSVRIGYFLLLK